MPSFLSGWSCFEMAIEDYERAEKNLVMLRAVTLRNPPEVLPFLPSPFPSPTHLPDFCGYANPDTSARHACAARQHVGRAYSRRVRGRV